MLYPPYSQPQTSHLHHTLAHYRSSAYRNTFGVLHKSSLCTLLASTLIFQKNWLFPTRLGQRSMETVTYSRIDNLEIQLDLYLPPGLKEGSVPALVHFHGGGMIAGCRKTLFFQQWLKGDARANFHHLPVSVEEGNPTLTSTPRRDTRARHPLHQRRPPSPLPLHRLRHHRRRHSPLRRPRRPVLLGDLPPKRRDARPRPHSRLR